MTRKFIGSNKDQSSRSTWYYRAKFETQAYNQPNAGDGVIKDITFFERLYYGTIDNNDYSVTPKEDKIVLTTDGKRVINFVNDAFTIMKKRIDAAYQFNNIAGSNPYILNFRPYQAYTPPNDSYKIILQNVLVNYNTIEIPNRVGLSNITSFEDYVKNFIKIISNELKDGYYTQTKWCRSPMASVFNSGLAISIADLKKGEDQEKINQFIDSEDFEYYLKLALNSGFSVSKDCPWILVFDLASAGAAPFLQPYNVRTLDDIFTEYYDRTELNDIILLRNILYKYYNKFILENRIERINKANCKRSYTEYKTREPLSIEQFDKQYPEEWFLDYYIDLRNAEEGLPYQQQSLNSIKKIAKNYYKTLDRSSALSYIASRFVVQTWSKPYGYDDTLDKISKSEAQQLQAQRRRTSGEVLVTFQTLDDKRDCKGVFYNGEFYFDKLPRNLDLTWSWSQHLEDYNVDFAELWVSGKDIGVVTPDHLRDRYNFAERRLQAHVKAIVQSQINLDDNCIYDLVPRHVLRQFYHVKNEITEWVVANNPKPKNYSFLVETQATINEIAQQDLRIDWDNHNLLFLQDPKAKSLYKRFAKQKSRVIYNLFGTITGRLTTTQDSFPIMNLKTEHRKIVMPQNDLFIELDFNAAEIRTLLALAGIAQPQDDIHKFNIEQVFKTPMSRDNAKRRFFAWLYNPDSKDEELKNYYNKEKILDKYYKNGYINTIFGRQIECDSFHSLNYLLQSTSSDNCMDRANKIRKMLSGRKSTIAFCLHDCVVLDFSNQDAHLLPQIKQVFEQTRLGKFKINLKAGKTYGLLEDFSW